MSKSVLDILKEDRDKCIEKQALTYSNTRLGWIQNGDVFDIVRIICQLDLESFRAGTNWEKFDIAYAFQLGAVFYYLEDSTVPQEDKNRELLVAIHPGHITVANRLDKTPQTINEYYFLLLSQPLKKHSEQEIEYGVACKHCGGFFEYAVKVADFECRSCKSYRYMVNGA